jgi:hypothetical protein
MAGTAKRFARAPWSWAIVAFSSAMLSSVLAMAPRTPAAVFAARTPEAGGTRRIERRLAARIASPWHIEWYTRQMRASTCWTTSALASSSFEIPLPKAL